MCRYIQPSIRSKSIKHPHHLFDNDGGLYGRHQGGGKKHVPGFLGLCLAHVMGGFDPQPGKIGASSRSAQGLHRIHCRIHPSWWLKQGLKQPV